MTGNFGCQAGIPLLRRSGNNTLPPRPDREGSAVAAEERPEARIDVAEVPGDVNPGIVVATLGYGRSLSRSDGSVNAISSQEWGGMGRCLIFSENLVKVSRVN